MKKKRSAHSAFFNLRALVGLLVCGVAVCSILSGALLAFFHPEAPSRASQRTLTFAEGVAYHRAIEDVYWRHRIWSNERPDPKPSLDAVMSQAQLEKKVEDYLLKSQTLEDHWQQPINSSGERYIYASEYIGRVRVYGWHLDRHQHRQRPFCPSLSHGSVDRNRDDCLGRIW